MMAQRTKVCRIVHLLAMSCGIMACGKNLKPSGSSQNHASNQGKVAQTTPQQTRSVSERVATPSLPRHTHDATEDEPAARVASIELDGFSPTLVYVPAGTKKKPALFVTHGAGGTAREHLRYWSELRSEYLIFSLAGTPLSSANPEGGHYYKTHLELEREMLALVDHLQHPNNASYDYVSRLEDAPWAYAGYSQGATMGALFLTNVGQLFDRLILIEGGTEGWTSSRSARFKSQGGRQVLWVCGTKSCFNGAQAARATAQQSNLSTELVYVQGAGHIYWGPVQEQVVLKLPTILDQ